MILIELRGRHANTWLEVDRFEKIKAMVAFAVVLTALVIGRWFLVRGVMGWATRAAERLGWAEARFLLGEEASSPTPRFYPRCNGSHRLTFPSGTMKNVSNV